MSMERDPATGEERRWLAAGLAGLREDMRAMSAPAGVERELRSRFRAARTLGHPLPVWRMLLQQFLVPALAIGIVVAVSVPVLWQLLVDPAISGEALASTPSMTPFYALSASAATPDPAQGVIVATELPRQMMLDFGLPVDPGQLGRPVEADVLLGATGEIIAVRFSNEKGDQQ